MPNLEMKQRMNEFALLHEPPAAVLHVNADSTFAQSCSAGRRPNGRSHGKTKQNKVRRARLSVYASSRAGSSVEAERSILFSKEDVYQVDINSFDFSIAIVSRVGTRRRQLPVIHSILLVRFEHGGREVKVSFFLS